MLPRMVVDPGKASKQARSSVYYLNSSWVPRAGVLSLGVRSVIHQRFMDLMQPSPKTRILDIGVTSDSSFAHSNYLERNYPYPGQITCVGTEDGSHLESQFPGLKFRRVEAGQPLPFADKSFDIAFSNAVIEHVGSRESQCAFAAEACRVARRVFLTTPNRWFPVEHHTGLPLLHWLPKPAFRSVLARTPMRYWAEEANLNHLTSAEFAACFRPEHQVEIELIGIGAGPWKSNLIAYTGE